MLPLQMYKFHPWSDTKIPLIPRPKRKIFYFKKKIIQIERRIGMFYQSASQQETDGTLKLGQFVESLIKGTPYKGLGRA